MAKLAVRSLGEVALGGGEPADLEQLDLGERRRHDDRGGLPPGRRRDPGGLPRRPRPPPLQAYLLPMPGQPLVVLSWRATRDASLVGAAGHVPPGGPAGPGGGAAAGRRSRRSAWPAPRRPATGPSAAADRGSGDANGRPECAGRPSSCGVSSWRRPRRRWTVLDGLGVEPGDPAGDVAGHVLRGQAEVGEDLARGCRAGASRPARPRSRSGTRTSASRSRLGERRRRRRRSGRRPRR